jgi:hypothetical protein
MVIVLVLVVAVVAVVPVLVVNDDDVVKDKSYLSLTQVGTWKPNPKSNEDAITMKNINPIKWVGDFSELVKCHNPGKPGNKYVKVKKVLRITAVIVSNSEI